MTAFSARLFLCLGILASALPASTLADRIVLGGTGGALGTMRFLAGQYTNEQRSESLNVLSSLGSSGGIKAVLSGAIDLALSSRSLKSSERRAGGRERPYGISALVFVAHARVGAANLTMEQILDIYSGAIRQWPNKMPIRPILRPLTDGDAQILLKYAPGLTPIYKRILMISGIPIAHTDQMNASKIEAAAGAIGFTSLPLVLTERRRLNVLSLNGIMASPNTIADKSYPLRKTFRFIVKGQPKPAVERFLDFVFSAKGAALLLKTGHVPLSLRPFE